MSKEPIDPPPTPVPPTFTSNITPTPTSTPASDDHPAVSQVGFPRPNPPLGGKWPRVW